MDINELIRQEINNIRAEESNGQPNGTPVPAPTPAGPITVNVQGQQVTFRDQADLEAQLNQTAQALRTQTPPVAQPPQQDLGVHGARVSGKDNDTDEFSPDKYIELMNKNPVDATNYALSHLLFGGQVEDAGALIRESLIQSATQARQLAAYQFRDAHREVPIDNPQVGQTIDTVRKQLGLPFTDQGLDAAYTYAVSKGYLPNFAAAQQQQQQQQQPQFPQQFQPQSPVAQQNPYLNAPPAPGRNTSGAVPITEADLESMSVDQLKKLMSRMTEMGAV